ncbi:MAG TPA: hypothetical protein PKE30_20980 [Niabella sp.]|nr:hypothetical protein [Niabella sp.]
MHQPSTPPAWHLLNRLAMDKEDTPAKTDPLSKLRHVFEYTAVHEILEELNLICSAAMNEAYVWKQGSPGNCLYYYGKLELLTECCYLFKTCNLKKTLKSRKCSLPEKLPATMLPIPLTAREFRNPLRVIKSFFRHASLPEWKRQLLVWTENALSNSSVKDELEAETLFPFIEHLHKLVYAAYLLCQYVYPEKKS